MDGSTDVYFREQLQDRRRKLVLAASQSRENAKILNLLQEVDAALERINNGTFGRCESCHDPIEHDRLLADPLLHLCLDHLTAEEQRALEQDLGLASEIQNGLLPKTRLRVPGWQVAYHYEPAGLVSGDYCDVISTEAGDFYFLLGDISGKGVAASMLMAHLHAIFRTLIPLRLSIEELMSRANRLFCESTLASSYATLVCGRTDKAGRIEICIAGHCPPKLLRSGPVESIEPNSLPLGLFCSSEFSVKSMVLYEGDVLLLYTDGVSEARNPDNQEYGEDRLVSLLQKHHTLSPEKLVEACRDDLTAFRAGVPKTDDVTIMALRREREAS
jgi:sigma-B regulation protein RsbU (phosphoserine phosphatase)